MLIIISDLHLSDGTLVPPFPAAAIGDLRQKIQRSAIAASHRVLDEYRPIDRVDLLLLGDTIDFLRTPIGLRPKPDCGSGLNLRRSPWH